MWKIILIFISVGASVANRVHYENYKVYRVIPESTDHLEALNNLMRLNFNFWTLPSKIGANVDVMVAPEQAEYFLEYATSISLKYNLIINDVENLIKEQMAKPRSPRFDFLNYHPLDVINAQLEEYSQNNPHVTVVKGGESYEGRNITGVQISFSPTNKNRTIVIEGGIHANEWIGHATVMYLLNALLTSADPSIIEIAQSYDWYVFPVYNPDGYEYTHTTDRMWRKTRKPYGDCYGADPNRNFDYAWNLVGTVDDPCSIYFAGESAFSETETKTLSEFLTSIGEDIYGYIAYHSYSQLLLIPYGYNKSHVENYDQLMDLGLKAADSLTAVHGTAFTVGNVVDILYPASGITMDWVKSSFGTPITYTYELRDTGEHGFLLPPEYIIPVGEEILASFVTLFQELLAQEKI